MTKFLEEKSSILTGIGAIGAMSTAGAVMLATAIGVRWIIIKEEKKSINEINEAWQKAWQEAKIVDNKIIPQRIFEPSSSDYKCDQGYLEMMQKMPVKNPTSKIHVCYFEYIKNSYNRIESYQRLRNERSRGGGRKGKENDAINITLSVVRGILIKTQDFDAGIEYENQIMVITFISAFLFNWASNNGKTRKTHCERVREYLNEASKCLKQMHQNKSAQEYLGQIGGKSHSIAQQCLRLAIIAIQPTEETFKHINSIEIKELKQNNIIKSQFDEEEMVVINKKNPFLPRLQALARILIDDEEDADDQKQATHVPEYDHLLIKKLYLECFHDGIIKSLSNEIPPIIKRIKKKQPGKTETTLEDLDIKSVKNRLYQFHILISLSCQAAHLYKLAFSVSEHAKNHGDIRFYTEEYTKLLIQSLRGLLESAKNNLNKCEELFGHIESMHTSISLVLKYQQREKYYSFCSGIISGFGDIESEIFKLEIIRDNPFIIKEKADQSERNLQKMITELSHLYNLDLTIPSSYRPLVVEQKQPAFQSVPAPSSRTEIRQSHPITDRPVSQPTAPSREEIKKTPLITNQSVSQLVSSSGIEAEQSHPVTHYLASQPVVSSIEKHDDVNLRKSPKEQPVKIQQLEDESEDESESEDDTQPVRPEPQLPRAQTTQELQAMIRRRDQYRRNAAIVGGGMVGAPLGGMVARNGFNILYDLYCVGELTWGAVFYYGGFTILGILGVGCAGGYLGGYVGATVGDYIAGDVTAAREEVFRRLEVANRDNRELQRQNQELRTRRTRLPNIQGSPSQSNGEYKLPSDIKEVKAASGVKIQSGAAGPGAISTSRQMPRSNNDQRFLSNKKRIPVVQKTTTTNMVLTS